MALRCPKCELELIHMYKSARYFLTDGEYFGSWCPKCRKMFKKVCEVVEVE